MKRPENTTEVGRQLATRRESLDLTQQMVATGIGITVTSVSAAENGRTVIMRGRRPLWERALRLKAGTISRAYATGTELEPADSPGEQGPPGYADMSDPYERVIWEMNLPEEQRRDIIDMIRLGKRARHSA
ncbi:helix-turn-helix domain-containing protein [Streptomyces sp. NPDC056638]|uniref:helix-turn-helix domain-containing protein n=1 Tax=Streptomyces sp. NPDC056638 TaxID=3345887 RepID=UPI00368E9179